jgi:predicted pyridoxine 5'-phosphate oxidase superfamily flavin-nucleotide-binding protein
MPQAFADIAFTPSVKAAQQRDSRRAGYARNVAGDAEVFNDRLGDAGVEFVAAPRSFYMAAVSETGWTCLRHHGGPHGFLKVLDAETVGCADYAGNRPPISVGNLAVNDRTAPILMDTMQRLRRKPLRRRPALALPNPAAHPPRPAPQAPVPASFAQGARVVFRPRTPRH